MASEKSPKKDSVPKKINFTCAPEKEDQVTQGTMVPLKLSCTDKKYNLKEAIIRLDDDNKHRLVDTKYLEDVSEAMLYLSTAGMNPGLNEVKITIRRQEDQQLDGEVSTSMIIDPPPFDTTNVQVGLQRTSEPLSDHLVLWAMIDHSTQAMSFNGGGQNVEVYKVDEASLLRLQNEVPPLILEKVRKYADPPAKGTTLIKASTYDKQALRDLLNNVFKEIGIEEADKNRDWYKNKLSAGLKIHSNGYQQYIDSILCNADDGLFRGVDAYEKLIEETERFLLARVYSEDEAMDLRKKLQALLEKRYGGRVDPNFVNRSISEYFVETNGETILPYLQSVNSRLTINGDSGCADPIRSRLSRPLFIELIWNYWHEENMLNQALQVISLRFQNRSVPGKGKAFDNFAIDPLRRINNLLWGYIQKESSRLSVSRRSNEYDHQYGLRLLGKAVGDFPPAESRSKFIEAFHNLLHLATRYYKEFDDTTIFADPFPLRNALREVHLVLSEGSHNQYGDLPWTARVEMLAQQYILARPEMREFLGGRIMVPYAEPWMDRLDAIKKVMGWGDTGSTHFRDLAYWGERLLLSVRFDQWNDINIQPSDAASWAEFWRNDIQGYIHAYRSVTGVDLSMADANNRLDYTMPAKLLQQRMNGKSAIGKPPVKASSNGQNGKVSKEVFTQHYNPM